MPPFNLQVTSLKLTSILLQVFWNSSDSFYMYHVRPIIIFDSIGDILGIRVPLLIRFLVCWWWCHQSTCNLYRQNLLPYSFNSFGIVLILFPIVLCTPNNYFWPNSCHFGYPRVPLLRFLDCSWWYHHSNCNIYRQNSLLYSYKSFGIVLIHFAMFCVRPIIIFGSIGAILGIRPPVPLIRLWSVGGDANIQPATCIVQTHFCTPTSLLEKFRFFFPCFMYVQ
jgi:hypothetical protein